MPQGLTGLVQSRHDPQLGASGQQEHRGSHLVRVPKKLDDLLPVIEAVMVRKLNEELAGNGGPGVRS
jgi:hypothetical protein